MRTLNLTATGENQARIKDYLEKNSSEILADKINNGVHIEKDGKRLLNKKDLNGFMNFALNEAKKLVDNGAIGTYVDDPVVFGWAIHYFEEDSIHGKLFNEDGSEYKPIVKHKTTSKPAPAIEVKPKPKEQFSLFDFMGIDTPKVEESVEEEMTEEEKDEAFTMVEQEEKKVQEKSKGSSVYIRYMQIQDKYPDYVIAYRLGDFYEVFGDNAKLVSNKLDLTLTGRDCGLEERIPMVGFPYHCAELYFNKILKFAPLAVVENMDVTVREQELAALEKIDYETGEVLTDTNDTLEQTVKEIDKDALYKLFEIFGDEITLQ